MPATSCGVSLGTSQTAAEISANGALLPYGFELEVNDSDGCKLYRWVRLKSGVAAAAGELVATEVVAASITKDTGLILAVAAQDGHTVRGAAVNAIADNGAGWVQYRGLATVNAGSTAVGVGDLIKTDAAGEVQPEAVIATATVNTIGVAITGGTSAAITADLHLW